MKKTTRSFLAFDDSQLKQIVEIRKALSGEQKKEISNPELFRLALGLGFFSQIKLTNFKRSNTGFRVEYFNAEDWTLFSAVHLSDSGATECLLDAESILDTAEEYAAGGISLMAEALRTHPDLRLWLQVQVQTAYATNGK